MTYPRCIRDPVVCPPIPFGRFIVAVGCVYELLSLWSRLPTITALVRRARRHTSRPTRLVAWLWCVGWCAHFLTD